MKGLRKVAGLLKWQLALLWLLAAVVAGTATTASASTGSVTWTTQPDFELNASTTNSPTTSNNIDTASSPGDVKIGGWRDFVTTATITCITANNKVYTTGVDRTSIAVIVDGSVVRKIALPARAAGVVYNSVDNKLYVGQYNDNHVIVIDCATDDSHTITVGNGAYAAAYNASNNKVYIANIGDQTVSIINGADDTLLATAGPVIAGATTASIDGNKVYLTNKANSYITVIDGNSNTVLGSFEVEAAANILGGQASGRVGLRADAQLLGIAATDRMRLSWNHDTLPQGGKIQFQVRTAADSSSLDAAQYQGPGGADSWYDLSSPGVDTEYEADGTVTASVDLGAAFDRMTEIQLSMLSDGISTPVLHSVTLLYQLLINATAYPGGSITPSGVVPVEYGADQRFDIAADTGYHILDVKVDGVSNGNIATYTFANVTTSHTIEAFFEINTYTLTYTAGPNGSISGPTPQMVTHGSNGTMVTAVPDYGYHFVSWSDGVLTPSRTDLQVTGDLNVTANFEINTYTLTYTAGPNGSISGTTPQQVTHGSNGTVVTAVPATGYHFVSWSDGLLTASRSESNVTGDISVAAIFASNTYVITATAGRGGNIAPSGQNVVNYGDDITFSILPDPGLTILKVTVDGVEVAPSANSYTFNDVDADHAIHVTFKPSDTALLVQSWTVGFTGTRDGGAVDPEGNYYYPGTTVHRVDGTGTHDWNSTISGSGFGFVATDSVGNVYSQDVSKGIIYKFNPSGGTTPVWSKTLPSPSNETGYNAMAVDERNGCIYVTQRQSGTNSTVFIYKLQLSDGALLWTGTTSFGFKATSMVLDSMGNIWVVGNSAGGGTLLNTVYKYDSRTSTVPVASFPFTGVTRITIDGADNIYGVTTNKLYRVANDGTAVWTAAPSPPPSWMGITTDGVNVYAGSKNYLYVYNAATGALKQTISNMPTSLYNARSYLSTDGYGSLWVHSVYSTADVAPITRFNLVNP